MEEQQLPNDDRSLTLPPSPPSLTRALSEETREVIAMDRI
jgi:hypothetical protein